MNLVADESIDRQVVDSLRKQNHVIWYIADIDPGTSDDNVLAMANTHGAVLLTADKDFGELVYRQRRVTEGVVLIRLAGQSPVQKAQIVVSAFEQHGIELPRAFSVIAPTRIRIRHPSI
jgi:predicted nuclease of predicted toxin-antitoxin system